MIVTGGTSTTGYDLKRNGGTSMDPGQTKDFTAERLQDPVLLNILKCLQQ